MKDLRFFKTAAFIYMLFFFINIHNSFSQTSTYSYKKYISSQGDTLNYRFLFPDADTIRKFPLVIFLHGSGERGNDNEAQLKWGAMNFASEHNMINYPAFVIAAQCPDKMDWANFSKKPNRELLLQPAPSKPMQLLIELIQQVIKDFRVDTNRIYITGLSMGGYGTYDAIERYPGLFAAAVPVCGGGDISKANSITHIPIWIFQGAEDPAVDPRYALDMLNALTAAGAHPGFTQYPGVGHFSWLGAYTDPLMMQWLFRQHKN